MTTKIAADVAIRTGCAAAAAAATAATAAAVENWFFRGNLSESRGTLK